MSDNIPAGTPTPANYHRSAGGHFQWQPPTPEHLQEMLPAYEILSILGQGGMGAVYKGRQKSLDRFVAIKILPPEAGEDDMQFVERFKNEARSMAKMNHPAIVHVYDFGETIEGQLYIVMEYVDGTDVARMIQAEGRLPDDYAIAITAHVCDALGYAHTQGIVHRDIKPANVLINMEGQVKVADFGLAKATDPEQMGLTKTNMAMGTPDFVSPEALISGMHLDGRADLYAVGVMLYTMLTGKIPRGAFRMPSETLQTDARFDDIILKAMEMDRDLRYQSAFDLRRDLDVILTTPVAETDVQALPAGKAAIPQKTLITGTGVSQSAQKKAAGAKAEARTPAKRSSVGVIYGITAVSVLSAGAFIFFSAGKKKPASSPVVVTAARPDAPKPKSTSATAPPIAAATPKAAEALPAPNPPAAKTGEILTFGGHRYQLVQEAVTWEEAKARAQAMGGHLATITSKEENEWILNDMKLPPGSDGHIFIGGSRDPKDKAAPWKWVTGEPLDMSLWVGTKGPDGSGPFLTAYAGGRHMWDDVRLDSQFIFLVEWDDGGTAKPAALIAAAPQLDKPVDLLALVDVQRDTIKGTWTRTPEGVVSTKDNSFPILEIEEAVPDEYDFEVEFTARDGLAEVNQALAIPGGTIFLQTGFGGDAEQTFFCFGPYLDGKKPDARPEAVVKRERLKVGQRYRMIVEVRRDSLRALIDGAEVLKWSGDLTRFSNPADYCTFKNPRHIGLSAYKSEVLFHKAELRSPGAIASSTVPNVTSTPSGVARTTVAPAQTLQTPGAINLLAGVDVQRDSFFEKWRLEDGSLKGPSDISKNGHETIVLPVAEVPANYDLRFRLTREKAGFAVKIFFVHGDGGGLFDFDGGKGAFRLRGFSSAPGTADTGEDWLKPGLTREVVIQVRESSVTVLIDGSEIGRAEGRAAMNGQYVKDANPETLQKPPFIGFNYCGGQVVVHEATFLPVPTASTPPATGLSAVGSVNAIEKSEIADPESSVTADPHLAQLAAGFKARHEADALQPFNTALAALNTSYLANGVSRARTAAKAKGSLTEVTALDAEKTAIEQGRGIPDEDDSDTPESLKTLRGTYRTAYAKHAAERDAKAAPLYDLYLKALDAYIAELTQADKIDTARKVQVFRDDIALQTSGAGAATAPPAGAGASAPPAVEIKGSSGRAAATWCLQAKGVVWGEGFGPTFDVKDLPASRFEITRLEFDDTAPEGAVTDATLAYLTRLRELNKFEARIAGVTGPGLEVFRTTPNLRELTLHDAKQLKDEHLAPLGALKELKVLTIYDTTLTGTALRHLAACNKLETLIIGGLALTAEQADTLHTLFPALKSLHISPDRLTPDAMRVVGRYSWLETLRFDYNPELTDDMLAPLSGLTALRELNFSGCPKFNGTGLTAFTGSGELRSLDVSYASSPVTGAALPVIVRTFPKLETLNLAVADAKDADFQALSALRNLSSLKLYIKADVSDGSLATLASLPSLEVLDIGGGTGSNHTAADLEHLLKSKSLTTLALNGGKNMDASIVPVLKKLKNLKILDLRGVSAKAAADEIRKALPGCKVSP